MKTIGFCLMIAFVFVDQCAVAVATQFGKALHENSIEFNAEAADMYVARMKLKIRNKKKKKMVVELEPGRIFYPKSESIQPFVVARRSIIALDPDEEKDVFVFARCGNSTARAPGAMISFNRTEMGKPDLVYALNMMNDMQIEPMGFYQQVIWFHTNKLDISAVHSVEVSAEIRNHVVKELCKRNKLEVPWYGKTYKPAESGDDMEFSNQPDKLKAEMEVVLAQRSDLQIHLFDDQGNNLRMLETRNMQPSGVHTIPIEIDLSELTAEQQYTVRITDGNGSVIESKSFKV